MSTENRYSRQIRFSGIGEAGQQRLSQSKVLLCGCGALGTALADTLIRAGVGFLRIVDRDFVDVTNLQRQVLFDEQDIADNLPKAVAAATKLSRINSQVTIESHVADFDQRNCHNFAAGVDLILDGTDNFETRFLINDLALDTGIPWVYAGVVGSHGQTMAIFPHQSACLRCVIESPPDPGTNETCDTAGVIAPAIQMVTALQSTMALKILSGQQQLVSPQLTIVDVWEGTLRQMNLEGLRDRGACPACGTEQRRDWLRGGLGSHSTILCGRNSVQISPAEPAQLALEALAAELSLLGKVVKNAFLIRFTPTGTDQQLTVFRDGRAIIQGTEEISVARSLYARYLGN